MSAESGFAKANPVRRGPVVLAIDGTECDGSAVVAARTIAARLDRPIEVITVLEPTPMSSATLDVGVRSGPADDDARRQTREIAVTDYVCRFSGGDTPPRVHVRVGDVSDEIIRFARAVFATTVVLGDGLEATSSELAMGQRCAPNANGRSAYGRVTRLAAGCVTERDAGAWTDVQAHHAYRRAQKGAQPFEP